MSLAPASIDVWYLTVLSLVDAGRVSEAADASAAALKIDPGHVPVRLLRVEVLGRLGRVGEAQTTYDELVAEDAVHRSALMIEAYSACARGDTERAKHLLRLSIQLGSDDRDATEMLQTLERGEALSRAPAVWLRRSFDDYAPSFEQHLVEVLQYRSHKQVGWALAATLGVPRGQLAILDLGCGTGLCGPMLRPYAERLVGVDISSQMLARAGERDMYNDLVEDELVHYLMSCSETFDVIVATDVLIYFGDVLPMIRGAGRHLQEKGYIVFTVERHDGSESFVQNRARYAHSRTYLEHVARQAGLRVELIQEHDARLESGNPVKAWLVILRPDPDHADS